MMISMNAKERLAKKLDENAYYTEKLKEKLSEQKTSKKIFRHLFFQFLAFAGFHHFKDFSSIELKREDGTTFKSDILKCTLCDHEIFDIEKNSMIMQYWIATIISISGMIGSLLIPSVLLMFPFLMSTLLTILNVIAGLVSYSEL